jgi:hypothetical protein
LALGVGRGDEVVVPDLVCQVLPITVFCTGAVPRLCDIDRETIALSANCLPEVLRSNTKSVIFAPLYGVPVDPSPVLEVAEKHSISLIVDAAQAMGACIGGKKMASFGDVGILSFNKFMNVDLGGAATTNDEAMAAKIGLFRRKYDNKSFFISLAYRFLETFFRHFWKSREIMKMIFYGDKYLYELLNTLLAKKYFERVAQPTLGMRGGLWVKPKPEVLKAWRSASFTGAMIDQLIGAVGGRRGED